MRTLKTISTLGVAAAVLLSAVPAFAEQGGGSSNRSGEIEKSRVAVTGSTTPRDVFEGRKESEREKVQQHLADIKDGAKQQLAAQLSVQFDNLNKTWTDHFSSMLDQYTAVLGKIQDRANIAAGKGSDVSSTTAAIQAAQTAITNARAAVAAQAAKTYTLASSTLPTTATSTSSGQEKLVQALRKSFQSLHTGLFKDLFALRDGPMKNARKAVQSALQSLVKVPKVDDDNATSTQH